MVINVADEKAYIGVTGRTIKQRWQQHLNDASQAHDKLSKGSLHEAMNEYGRDVWIIAELDYSDDPILAGKLEQYWIQYCETTNPTIGYNRTFGGEGIKEASIRQMRATLATPEMREQCRQNGLKALTSARYLKAKAEGRIGYRVKHLDGTIVGESPRKTSIERRQTSIDYYSPTAAGEGLAERRREYSRQCGLLGHIKDLNLRKIRKAELDALYKEK